MVVAVTVAVLAVAAVVRSPSPVGHFTSAAGQDRFRAAYGAAMAELPDPNAVLDLRTGFGVVRLYRFDGAHPDRTPLVLLPGRSSGVPVWADNLASLLEIAPVYALDLLGEPGYSVQDRPITSDDDQAVWLAEVLQQLPEPRVHLVGMSIGGWTAANLAVRRPDLVGSVILLDPVLVFADLSPAVIIRSLPATVRWLPKSWRDDFASWTANDAPVVDEPVGRMIEAGMQTYALKLPAPRRIVETQLRALDRPVLVILAGRSRMHDAQAAAEVARATLPRGQVELYPDASHAINGEHPAQIAADVATFLGHAT